MCSRDAHLGGGCLPFPVYLLDIPSLLPPNLSLLVSPIFNHFSCLQPLLFLFLLLELQG